MVQWRTDGKQHMSPLWISTGGLINRYRVIGLRQYHALQNLILVQISSHYFWFQVVPRFVDTIFFTSGWPQNSFDKNSKIFIDREAGEIMRLVASVCLFTCGCVYVFPSSPVWIIAHKAGEMIHLVVSIRPSILARSGRYWYLALPSTAKGPLKHSYTLKHNRVCISRIIPNGWAFKMVGVPTGGAIAVDHAFNSWIFQRISRV